MHVESTVHIIPSLKSRPAYSSVYLSEALRNRGVNKVYIEDPTDPSARIFASLGITNLQAEGLSARKPAEGRGAFNRRIFSALTGIVASEREDRIDTRKVAGADAGGERLTSEFAMLLSEGLAQELISNALSRGKHDGKNSYVLREGILYKLKLTKSGSFQISSSESKSAPYSFEGPTELRR